MPKAIQLDLDARVPGTKFTARQVCRVKRTRNVKAGTLLAYEGAYDNKAVIVSVKLLARSVMHPRGFMYAPNGLYDKYEIVVRRLGKFFSDGRVAATPFRRKRSTRVETVYIPWGSNLGDRRSLIGRWSPVAPSGAAIRPCDPFVTMDEVERMALRMAQSAWDEVAVKKSKFNMVKSDWQVDITARQQELKQAVRDRTYRREDFLDLLPAAADKLIKEKQGETLYMQNRAAANPMEPEACLAMFAIK